MKSVLGLAAAILVGAAFCVVPAKADQLIDFSCGSGTCSGTVTASGGNFSTTGIGVTSNIASEPGTDTFSLVFDTSNGTIHIDENSGSGLVADFVGTISQVTSSSCGPFTCIQLGVNWTTIPGDVSGSSGTTPFPAGSVVDITTNGNAFSVDIPVSTVPEPSAVILLAAGLMGLALHLKFKGALSA